MNNKIDFKKKLKNLEPIKVNPNNERYFTEQFIKGFNLGAKTQLQIIKEKAHE